ncbi:MAG: T9SS type B sorting domain-containing protein [Bacteroidota bacterium]
MFPRSPQNSRYIRYAFLFAFCGLTPHILTPLFLYTRTVEKDTIIEDLRGKSFVATADTDSPSASVEDCATATGRFRNHDFEDLERDGVIATGEGELYKLRHWEQATVRTSDFLHNNGWRGGTDRVGTAPPTLDGRGFVGSIVHNGNWVEYIGSNLDEPLRAGETYELDLLMGTAYANNDFGGAYSGDFVIYGFTEHQAFPLDAKYELSPYPGILELVRQPVDLAEGVWTEQRFVFTPTVDIHTVIIGGENFVANPQAPKIGGYLLYDRLLLREPCEEDTGSGVPEDTDGDGIIDAEDLDDDNDGILDTVEGCIPNDATRFRNHDFEEYTGLPSSFTQLHLLNFWDQATQATSDFLHMDGWHGGTGTAGTAAPTPDGKGFVASIYQNASYVEYIGSNLDEPLRAGIEYELDMLLGTAMKDSQAQFYGSFNGEFVIYGFTAAQTFPLPFQSVPPPSPVMEELLRQPVTLAEGIWAEQKFVFTPTEDIHAVMIGGENHTNLIGQSGVYLLHDRLLLREHCSNDTDGDGIPDQLDLDSDNDGISDLYESGADVGSLDPDGNGTIDGTAYMDVDGDGLADAIEALHGQDTGTPPRNTDPVTDPDYLSLDSDGDGIPDAIEALPSQGYTGNDGDVSDEDNDGDGIIAAFDPDDGAPGGFGGVFPEPRNTDVILDMVPDALPDYLDPDSDGDGLLDSEEGGDTVSGTSYQDPDGNVDNPLEDLPDFLPGNGEAAYREDCRPVLEVPDHVSTCGRYILPPLSVGNYFTAPLGDPGRLELSPGHVVEADQQIYVYAGTAPNCDRETSFGVEIMGLTVSDPEVELLPCGPGENAGGMRIALPEGSVDGGSGTHVNYRFYREEEAEEGSTSLALLQEGGDPVYIWRDILGGTVLVEVEDDMGCTGTARVELPFREALVAEVETEAELCVDSGGRILLTVSGGVPPYTTSVDGGPLVEGRLVYDGLASGVEHRFEVVDANGCSVELSAMVLAAEPLLVTSRIDQELCLSDGNGRIALTISGGRPPYSTNLDGNGQVSDKLVYEDLFGGREYLLEVIDANGCSMEIIIPLEAPVNLAATVEVEYLCAPESTVPGNEVRIGVDPSLLGDVLFALDGDFANSFPEPVFRNVAPGRHSISMMYKNGCTKESPDFAIVAVSPLSMVVEEPGINTVQLSASGGGGGYEYRFGEGAYGTQDTFAIRYSGVYEVAVRDAYGCEVVRLVELEFLPIEIPNFFTPDGDGTNDGWTPRNIIVYPNARTKVFDRYGRQITELAPGEKWYGLYQDNMLPSGDYWYILELNDREDARSFVGNFTLYR